MRNGDIVSQRMRGVLNTHQDSDPQGEVIIASSGAGMNGNVTEKGKRWRRRRAIEVSA